MLPGKVLVLGADVTMLELDHQRMRFLDLTLDSVNTLYSSETGLIELLPEVDLLVGAVLVPGAVDSEKLIALFQIVLFYQRDFGEPE